MHGSVPPELAYGNAIRLYGDSRSVQPLMERKGYGQTEIQDALKSDTMRNTGGLLRQRFLNEHLPNEHLQILMHFLNGAAEQPQHGRPCSEILQLIDAAVTE